MKTLELRLSPLGDARIKVIAHSFGASDSVIPFDKGNRRITILKSLNALDFHHEDFSADEKEWMVQNGLLNADKLSFRPDMQANIGKTLYETLFPKGSNTEKALDNMTFGGSGLHIQIEVEGDVEQHRLFDYPWELLWTKRGFLIERGINVSRYIALENSPPNLPPLKRINVLLVSSRAFDLENGLFPLSNEEQQAVRRGLDKAKDAQNAVSIPIDELPQPVTFEKLSQYLLEHIGEETPHIIHFDGHGRFGILCRNTLAGIGECKTFNPGMSENCKNEKCSTLLTHHQGYLLFEDSSGKPDYVSAQDIATLVGNANRNNETNVGITLVVLSACLSSLSLAENSVFNGVAQRLISQRIPAVVGMAFSITVDSAIAFTEHFYRAVRQKLPLVSAMNWARQMMRIESNQWYRPVLYMRWQDHYGGQMFTNQTDGDQVTQPQPDPTQSQTLSASKDTHAVEQTPTHAGSPLLQHPVTIPTDHIFHFDEIQLPNPSEFFGQEYERIDLIKRTGRRNSTAIVGDYRSGKSWLMQYLQQVTPSHPQLGPNVRIGRLSARHPQCQTPAGFVKRALEVLSVPNHDANLKKMQLERLANAARDLRNLGIIPVLCIDEFAGLIGKTGFDKVFLSGLRAVAQDDGLVLIAASRQSLHEVIENIIGESSPLFNIMPQLVLKPFTEQTAKTFVKEKSLQASFNEDEQGFFLDCAAIHQPDGAKQWPPMRLQLVGQLLLDDKRIALDNRRAYNVQDALYQSDFRKRLEERYRAVVKNP